MSAWIPTALAIAITAVTSATAASGGPCSRENSRNCLNFPAVLNFSSVPTISEQIVTEEHTNPRQQKLTIDPPAAAPYTGPTFGTSLGRRAPTVGYQWSLE
jgi:hypothetical protein